MITTEKIDRFIELRRQINLLEMEASALASDIKAAGPHKHAGTHGIVNVIAVSGRKTTKWPQVCAAANVPQEVIDRYTTQGAPSLRIDVM